MATVAAPKVESRLIPDCPIYRFTVEQYHRMIQDGILTEDDRVELLEGWIVPKMPHNPPHDGTISLIQRALLAHLPSDWLLRIQSSITLRDSEPEPDLVVARGPARRYMEDHPRPRDLGLVIEVADTSLSADRVRKGRVFARARIGVYWVVNLQDRQIEVYTQPRGGRNPAYQQRQDYRPSDSIPVILDGREICRIPVQELLP